jgi:uncharacterized cupredoxin-like copper-binding protein
MRRLLVLLPAAALLAACGGGSNEKKSGGPVVQTIQISEKEFSLSPRSVTLPKSGTYAFEVTNDGQVTHALNIEANGGGGDQDEVESGDIDPGAKKTVRFTFAAGGSYEMYCPVDGHKEQGMKGTIMVGGTGAGGGGTTTGENDTTTGETTTNGKPGY